MQNETTNNTFFMDALIKLVLDKRSLSFFVLVTNTAPWWHSLGEWTGSDED